MPAEIAYIYAMGTGTWPVGARIALNAERYVHWQLREHHIRGEWFNVSRAEILAAVEAAIAMVGEFDPYAIIPSVDPGDRLPEHPEHILTRFPKGTKDSIDSVLAAKEKRADLIREAVEREIKRRERCGKPAK